MKGYVARIARLAALGLLLACAILAIAAGGAIFNGRPEIVVRGRAVSVWNLSGAYLVGGALAGMAVGILYPMIRWRLGAAVVGVVALLPLSLSMARLFGEQGDVALIAGIVAVVLGGVLGPVYREFFYSPPKNGIAPRGSGF